MEGDHLPVNVVDELKIVGTLLTPNGATQPSVNRWLSLASRAFWRLKPVLPTPWQRFRKQSRVLPGAMDEYQSETFGSERWL